MTTASHDHEAGESITDEVHDNSWSVNLEQPRHAADEDLVIEEAIEAVEHTAPGNHVNLVTHGDLGHPEEYLIPRLRERYPDFKCDYVQQCGCGGHVTRVHVE